MSNTFERRNFIKLGLGAFGGAMASAFPNFAFANADTDTRFLFVIQRGAADGLDSVIPYADPAYARARGALAISESEAIKLNGTFALHPSLVNIGELYKSGQAAMVHAIASPYRERSHFDGQNIMESGGLRAYEIDSGWLNRFLTLLAIGRNSRKDPIALSATIPMALRGTNPVTSYAPSNIPASDNDYMSRIGQLYETDAQLYALWMQATATREMAAGENNRQNAGSMGRLAASFLVRDDGPRIAMVESNGWDTHQGQKNRLENGLRGLDAEIATFKAGMGDKWAKTIVLIATEFGRTIATNGTIGTDHGTGSVAYVLGGKVNGGRVIADWPGLANAQLYEGRDLKPTADLYGLIAGVLGEGFGIEPQLVARTLFPALPNTRALGGLVRV